MMNSIKQLREIAPYIQGHRNTTLVVLIQGEVQQFAHYPTIIKDLVLLHSIGVQLVLVFGLRPQIDLALAAKGKSKRVIHSLRITSEEDMAIICEQISHMQMRHNALFSATLPVAPLPSYTPSLLWGNWISAQPLGVIDGVDFERTGTIRKVEQENIQQLIAQKHILAFHCIAPSRLGHLYNVRSEDISQVLATTLHAHKLIVLTDARDIEQIMTPGNSISYHQLEQMLPSITSESKRSLISMAIAACKGQVRRVHVIDACSPEALLRELFTREGSSLMITDDSYETITKAKLDMTPAIHQLIAPMEQRGLLRPREVQLLEQQVNDFFVLIIEGNIAGCAALHRLNNQVAELACFVIDSDYQGKGRGYRLLEHMTSEARQMGMRQLLVLTTRTKDWFEMNGFEQAGAQEYDWLFASGRYDVCRNARVLVKHL